MIAREESRDERGLTIIHIEERSVARWLATARSLTCVLFLHTFKVCGARRWKAGSETVHAIV